MWGRQGLGVENACEGRRADGTAVREAMQIAQVIRRTAGIEPAKHGFNRQKSLTVTD